MRTVVDLEKLCLTRLDIMSSYSSGLGVLQNTLSREQFYNCNPCFALSTGNGVHTLTRFNLDAYGHEEGGKGMPCSDLNHIISLGCSLLEALLSSS